MPTARTPRPDAIPEITRGAIVNRAESRLRRPVPFSRTRFHHDRHGGLGLPGLTTISPRIAVTDLLAGDLLVDGTRAALFHEWADADRTACRVFEQAPATGTTHRLVRHTHLEARRHPRPAR